MPNSPYRRADLTSPLTCPRCGAPLEPRAEAASGEQQGGRCQRCLLAEHDLLAFFDMMGLGASAITGSSVFLAAALTIHGLAAFVMHREGRRRRPPED